jgi:hypothetical protein
MIVEQTERNVRSSGMGESVNFGIDQEDMAFVTSLLTDKLYSDKPLAVVREYICNAIDANVEAGRADSPIFITVPTEFEPTFKVRDNGLGLSYEQVTRLYIKLGKSTKRESNNQIGAFGIGCKAAFSYTDSFNITSWYNGVRYSYTAQKDGRGGLILIPVGEELSDEPSGVEIEVAINDKDIRNFNDKIGQFCKYLTVKPNFSGGFEAKPFVLKVNDENFFLEETDYRNNFDCKVLMGNVVYPVDLYQLKYKNLCGVVLKVGLGDVDVSPDREKLEYTSKTMASLNDKIEVIFKKLKAETQAKIDTVDHIVDAVEIFSEMRSSFNQDFSLTDFTFKGRAIPKKLEIPCDMYEQHYRSRKFRKYSQYVGVSSLTKDVVIVIAPEGSRIMPTRLLAGISQKFGFTPTKFLVTDNQELMNYLYVDTWEENHIVKDYKSLWAKVDRTGRAHGTQKVYGYLRNERRNATDIDDIDDSEKVYVEVEGNSLDCVRHYDYNYVCAARNLGLTFYGIQKTRLKGILSEGGWTRLDAVVKEYITDEAAKINADNLYIKSELMQISYINHIWDILKEFKKDFSLDNQDTIEFIKKCEKPYNETNNSTNLINAANTFGIKITTDPSAEIIAQVAGLKEFVKKYSFVLQMKDRNRWDFDEYKKGLTDYIQMKALTTAEKAV